MVNGKEMKLLMKLWIVGFGLLFILTLSIGVVSFYPFDPIHYKEAKLDNQVVVAGKTITFTINFDKFTNRVGSMTRYLKSYNGDATILLGPFGLADATTDETHRVVICQIPDFVTPGPYKIRTVVVYNYFGIREVRATYDTPVFTVIGGNK